ncbi:MAG: DUF192 domain-containing protein [Duodenibacillus sp.]|nr:DUF192 domain-containing protein [Duodenibacillus sp.]
MRSAALACAALLCAAPGLLSRAAAADLVEVGVAGLTLRLEAARTVDEQRTGLMRRAALAPDAGMIFLFQAPFPVAMWMKDTLIDLDAAFVDACGRILNIERMKAGTLDLHRSAGYASAVIEMNAGWFAAHGVKPGMRVRGAGDARFCPAP